VYLSLADQNPKVVVIDASKDIDNVQTQITDKLTAWLTTNL
jgi:thymidylate kinase